MTIRKRYNGPGKGDGKRPADPEHCDPNVLNTQDMGSVGCKRGCHTFYEPICHYCGRTKEEINAESER